jgi:hypothetical protein
MTKTAQDLYRDAIQDALAALGGEDDTPPDDPDECRRRMAKALAIIEDAKQKIAEPEADR